MLRKNQIKLNKKLYTRIVVFVMIGRLQAESVLGSGIKIFAAFLRTVSARS
jgi:hypothetical protein